MKETSRQHYVPRTYLQKFATKKKCNYNINAADKKDLTKIIYPNVTNVCLETDIYTLKGDTEEQRQAIETFYSDNVENIYNEVYETLVDESITEISEEMHYKIVMTIITMLFRTSKWIHEHNDLFDTVLENTFSLCEQAKKDYFIYEGYKYSIKGKSLSDIQKEFRERQKDIQIKSQLEIAFKLINIRKNDGILISKLSPEHKLITSDNPVILSNIEHGIIAPFNLENTIRLPIDSNHILTILPHSQSDGKHRISRTNHKGSMSLGNMVANNYSQYESSFMYIIGHKNALSEFSSKKADYEKPITKEQEAKFEEIKTIAKEIIK